MRFVARDIINEETGAIYAEAGDELTQEVDKEGNVTRQVRYENGQQVETIK